MVQGGVHGQDVRGVDGEAVAVDVDHMHVLRQIGEEDRPLTGAAHQRQLLAGRAPAPALPLELGVELQQPLVGDHGALAGQHIVVTGQLHPQQLRILRRVAVLRLDLGVSEERTLHGCFPFPRRLPVSPGPGCGPCCPRSAGRPRSPARRTRSGTPHRCPGR